VHVALGRVDLEPGTRRLRLVHRHIGALHQRVHVRAVLGEAGDPEAGLHVDGEAANGEGLVE
jgi:hypothetical protein